MTRYFLSLAVLSLAALPAFAVTSMTSCGTISASGNYVLANNLTASTSSDCIDIKASNVSLNLNGHTITGSYTVPLGSGVNVAGTPHLNHVAITGPGLIHGFGGYGIFLVDCDYCQVGQVTATQNVTNGIYAGYSTYLNVGGNVAGQNQAEGIQLQSCISCTVQYNDASGNHGDGIFSEGGSGNTINNNTTDGNGVGGIGIQDTGTRVYSNTANGNSNFGIYTGGSGDQITNNTAGANSTTDLVDFNSNCGSNIWRNNTFFTSNPSSCIN